MKPYLIGKCTFTNDELRCVGSIETIDAVGANDSILDLNLLSSSKLNDDKLQI
jgi:hypothetical protein